jgi:MipA family protein
MLRSALDLNVTALTATASLIASGLLTFGVTPAWAQSTQQRPPNFLALGVAVVPEFEGSADRSAVPALIGRLAIGTTSLRLLGNSAQWNWLPASSSWAMGPVLSLRSARDEDVEDAVVKRLRPIDATAGAGAFVDYSWSGLVDPGDSLTAGFELLGGKNGSRAQLSLGYQWQAATGLRINTSTHVGLASTKYQRTYFDVDVENAARSGLPRYAGESGVDELGLAIGASYEVSRDWLLIGRLQMARLTGDAGDSPIVKLRGNRNQSTFVLAIGRSF